MLMANRVKLLKSSKKKDLLAYNDFTYMKDYDKRQVRYWKILRYFIQNVNKWTTALLLIKL